MATSIPPHNLGEVCDALIYLLDNWKRLDDIGVEDLLRFIQGPDFPTGGIVYRETPEGEDALATPTAPGAAASPSAPACGWKWTAPASGWSLPKSPTRSIKAVWWSASPNWPGKARWKA